jgi:hypothetical protein
VSDTAGRTLPEPDFPQAPFGRVGYAADEVEAFVEELRRALRHDPPAMAPYEVVDQRFRATRRHGYAMRPVDEYLAEATALLRRLHGEDAVAGLEGHEPEERRVATLWIYAVGLVLVLVILGFALTQL